MASATKRNESMWHAKIRGGQYWEWISHDWLPGTNSETHTPADNVMGHDDRQSYPYQKGSNGNPFPHENTGIDYKV